MKSRACAATSRFADCGGVGRCAGPTIGNPFDTHYYRPLQGLIASSVSPEETACPKRLHWHYLPSPHSLAAPHP
jgi:hypothetical protein